MSLIRKKNIEICFDYINFIYWVIVVLFYFLNHDENSLSPLKKMQVQTFFT